MNKRISILRSMGKKQLQKICDESSSIKEILEKCGLSWNGSSNYKYFKDVVRELNIDLNVLNENTKFYRIKKSAKARSHLDEDIFIKQSTALRRDVKYRIIKEKLIEYKCRDCGNTGIWNNKIISLQLEHINGINNDNRLENLCFLCPNCHSQTKTYGGKNTENKKINDEKRKNILLEKEAKKEKYNGVIKMRKAYIDTIDVMTFGWVEQVSKEWNISHTSVRRWIKKYYPELKFYERKNSSL